MRQQSLLDLFETSKRTWSNGRCSRHVTCPQVSIGQLENITKGRSITKAKLSETRTKYSVWFFSKHLHYGFKYATSITTLLRVWQREDQTMERRLGDTKFNHLAEICNGKLKMKLRHCDRFVGCKNRISRCCAKWEPFAKACGFGILLYHAHGFYVSQSRCAWAWASKFRRWRWKRKAMEGEHGEQGRKYVGIRLPAADAPLMDVSHVLTLFGTYSEPHMVKVVCVANALNLD